jgi:hypothetical protein
MLMRIPRKKLALVLAAVVWLAGVACGRTWAQDEDEGPMSNMHFVVLRDSDAKPVKNAALILHPVTRKGKQEMGGLELKTDADGKTAIDGIPYGPLRVQVIVPGYQTFGEDYQVKQPETTITIKMKRPVKQFSSYGVQDKPPPDQKKPDDATTEKKPSQPNSSQPNSNQPDQPKPQK